MKIAYFLDIATGLGGAGNVLLEQAKIMSTIHDVVVVIPYTADKIINKEYRNRCEIGKIPYVGLYYSSAYLMKHLDILQAQESVEEIKLFLLREKIDFIHSVQLNLGVEFAARALKIPHLMNVYQMREEEFLFSDKDIFPKFHSCDSELFCSLWSEKLQIPSRCIRPSALLDEIRKKENVKKQETRLLMLGSICGRKNQLQAIKAVEICYSRGTKVTLTIAGDDTSAYADACKRYVEENNLSIYVTIMGFQSNVIPLFQENDALLCASIDESFPSSIVEAITYDLFIITTPVAGVPELMINGRNAFVSSGYGAQQLADTIDDFVNTKKTDEIFAIRKNAHETWQTHFSRSQIREQLNDYYLYIKEHYNGGGNVDEVVRSAQCAFDMLKKQGLKDEILSRRVLYYSVLKEKIQSGTAYIWGAGKYGKIAKDLIECLYPEIQIEAFIDSNKTGQYLGKNIISPDKIVCKNVDYIFLGFVGDHNKIISFLEEKQYVYNKDLWTLP